MSKEGNNYLGEFEEFVMMAILRLNNETYGVPISEFIEKNTGKPVSTGALYTTLSRLEEKNYISSKMGEKTSERGGRAKKFYMVEALGIKVLQTSINARMNMLTGLEPVLGVI